MIEDSLGLPQVYRCVVTIHHADSFVSCQNQSQPNKHQEPLSCDCAQKSMNNFPQKTMAKKEMASSSVAAQAVCSFSTWCCNPSSSNDDRMQNSKTCIIHTGATIEAGQPVRETILIAALVPAVDQGKNGLHGGSMVDDSSECLAYLY